jgi:mannose-6-phosphate isomerase-like protein (cupin superfamily)
MNMLAKVQSEAELLWFGNTLVTVKLAAAAGDSGISVIEHWMPYGEAPPLHVHHREDEVFHILEGTMRFRVDDGEIVAHAGDTVLAPKGIPHCFHVDSIEGAHCLTIMHGSDFETMVCQASRSVEWPGLPEAAAPTPATIDMLTRVCAANRIDILGPPIA